MFVFCHPVLFPDFIRRLRYFTFFDLNLTLNFGWLYAEAKQVIRQRQRNEVLCILFLRITRLIFWNAWNKSFRNIVFFDQIRNNDGCSCGRSKTYFVFMA